MINGASTIIEEEEIMGDHVAMPNIREKDTVKNRICLVSYFKSCPNRKLSHFMILKRGLNEKRPHHYSKHGKIILLYDNAHLHITKSPWKQLGSLTSPSVINNHCFI